MRTFSEKWVGLPRREECLDFDKWNTIISFCFTYFFSKKSWISLNIIETLYMCTVQYSTYYSICTLYSTNFIPWGVVFQKLRNKWTPYALFSLWFWVWGLSAQSKIHCAWKRMERDLVLSLKARWKQFDILRSNIKFLWQTVSSVLYCTSVGKTNFRYKTSDSQYKLDTGTN